MNSLFPSLLARFVSPFAPIPLPSKSYLAQKQDKKMPAGKWAGKIAALVSEPCRYSLRSIQGIKPRPLAPGFPLRKHFLFDVFAMQRHVETFTFLFFRDTQTHEHVDDLQQDEADHAALDQRGEHALGLQQDTAVRAADVLDREDAGQERAENTAYAVDAERVERIVVAELRLEPRCRPEADHASQDADHERAGPADITRCRSNSHQTSTPPRDEADPRRLPLPQPLREHPAERSTCGRDLRRQHRETGTAVSRHCRTRVEGEPADPQHRSTDQREQIGR